MYNKEKILEIINQDGLFIDKFILEAFIKNWKIDPIYEDENSIEYFDEMTIEKIKQAISQKNQSKCEIHIMDKDEVKEVDMGVEIPETPLTPDIEPEKEEPAEDEQEPLMTPIQEVPVLTEQAPSIPDANAIPNNLPMEIKNEVENELKNITVDISNQTLAVLAQSIARKITADVSEFLKKSDFIEDAVHLGEMKKDNEILVEKIEELLADNKILVRRIQELEDENDSYVKVFGNIYVKNT